MHAILKVEDQVRVSAADLAMFQRFGVLPELVVAAQIERVTDEEARSRFGITRPGDMTGLIFPYFPPNGTGRSTARLRRDHPEIEGGKPKNKYIHPWGDNHHLYFPVGATELLKDPTTIIIFVESEKGALAVLAWARRTGRNVLVVATGGCWGWRGRIGKAQDASGVRVDEVGGLPELACVENREIYLLFDANAASNTQVQAARRAFASELRKRKAATVTVLELPEGAWNGPDDYIAAEGDEAMAAIFARASEPKISVGSLREDTANADRFARQNEDKVRYWHGRNRWVLWNETHWAEDEDGGVAELAKDTSRSIYLEAAGLPEEEAKRMGRWAERSLNRDRIMAMLDLAKSDPRIRMTTEQFDTDPWLLNFLDGTVDLRTGEAREHRRGDYITKLVRYPYIPCFFGTRWPRFLEETFGELAAWIVKAVGYSVGGSTREKTVFLLLGPTDTGKTTFLVVLRTIFADYCSSLQIETLMWTKNQDNNTSADLADLRGARLVTTSETEEGQRLRESKLKRIVQGQGTIKTARKYENPITFPETHKLWIDANFAPTIRGVDDSIWRRLLPVPCRHKLAEAEKDTELASKLLEEAPAIAAWAVAGAVLWYDQGLGRPEPIERERAAWRSSMDLVGDFLAEYCVDDPGASVGATELYQKFLETQGRDLHFTQTLFGSRMAAHGFEKCRDTATGRWGYRGLKWRGML